MQSSHVLNGRKAPESWDPGATRPIGVLLMLFLVATGFALALMSNAARGYAQNPTFSRSFFVRSDTDSTAINRDSLQLALADSIRTDSTVALPDTGRASKYFSPFRKDRPVASLFDRNRPFLPQMGSFWKHELKLDSTGRYYIAREIVGSEDVRYPLRLDYDSYRQARLARDMQDNWHTLIDQQERLRQQQQRGGLGFNIVVPGGRQSAFSTIFGKPEVDLRVTGQAYITAGFDYRKSDQQVAYTGRASRTDPTFKQDLSLGITGTIGDKMQVDVSWDTKNQFDYQNQLKLRYTGHEDEIIKNIEAGNVFLQTPNTLIRGGQSLFGIKSEFQVGGIKFTTVASQQEGQSNSLSIEGGSQTTTFDLRPTDFDDYTHFFLGYYFRNRWEDALSAPPNVTLFDGFDGITDIEVWKLQYTSAEEANVRQVVALVDLGEPVDILSQANNFTDPVLPNELIDQYDQEEIDQYLTPGTATPDTYLKTTKKLGTSDYQVGKFKLLVEGRDYDLDDVLGYISLRQRLQDNEALAVAFRYVSSGQAVQIGDFAAETGGSTGSQNDEKLVLKLLRPINLKQPALENDFNPAAWYLELRNIYRLRSFGINPNEFELKLEYEPPGKTASVRLPGVGGTQTLLQILGLDRVNVDGASQPDNKFDYLIDYTINPSTGLLIFPYLEPFGERIAEVIEESGNAQAQQNEDLYVFNSLYTEKKENARRDTQRDVYRVRGSYKGSTQSHYDLGAYAGLIEGSVRVTSGGTPLTEGVDFVVDYASGSVDIRNPAYLTSGRDIQITYEQNQFLNLQKKTLLGAMAEYNWNDQLVLSTTLMRLNQKSPVDKLRIGEEPVSNLIWGTYGKLDLDPRWLTQAVDALPFIQTKAPSVLSLTGEFAQLRPSHIETIAFDRTRRELRNSDRDFQSDELRGISYLDDFEGFESSYSLRQAGAWQLSAPPDSIYAIDPMPGDPDLNIGSDFAFERSKWKGNLSWYQLNYNILRELGVSPTPATDVVLIKHVFPNRDTSGETDQTLPTFDINFNPRERGPYNYTNTFAEFWRNPKLTWGGITQRIPDGYNDFNLKNIEFIEFVFRPFAENASNDAGADAKLYVDLGSISEDVIPNEKLNTEDGLSTATISAAAFDAAKRSRLPQVQQNSAVDINPDNLRTEDLGLDGLASYAPENYREGGATAAEQDVFADFLTSLRAEQAAISDPLYQAEIEKAFRDPSGDDYHYFLDDYFSDSRFYPNGASIQQRFSRYFAGMELNSYEGQRKLSPDANGLGNSRMPDTEDLNLNSTVDTDNSYFQYELPLSNALLAEQASETALDDYIVTEITGTNGQGTGWYQARIPVRKFTRKVGDIQDFNLMESIRIWVTGVDVPVTIRFASLELVGSQWQKSENVTAELLQSSILPADTTSRLTISSINNEENPNIYSPPIGTIISQTRLATGNVQNAREQAMVLRVEDLQPGQQRAIYKTFQGFDLLKYENLRLFVHMHGKTADGRDLVDLSRENLEVARSKAKLFIRLGANETNDFYEYEQPLTPGPFPQTPNIGDRSVQEIDDLWRTNQVFNGEFVDLNSVRILLGAFNQMKVARDNFRTEEGFSFPTDSVFWNADEQGNLLRDGVPNASEFAPPGTRLGIKGTPSLGRINTIVIGIRNPADPYSADPANVLEDVEVWINELRASGYDEANGWAALLNTDITLADLGRIKASFQQQTDGFGGLESTLDQREQQEFLNWGVNADVNLDKFIPERFGWNLPVSVQLQSNTTTPRFAPNRGDVRVDEILTGIDNENIDVALKEQKKQEVIAEAQTASMTRSFTARIAKQGSKSKFIRNTLDGLSISYSYANTDARNPSLRLNDTWRWMGTINYRFASRRPRTLRPFWFLEPIPILGMLGDLRFNYLPQSVTAAGTASRNFSQSQDRPGRVNAVRDTSGVILPDLVEFPFREQHTFGHRRQFGIQYNPFSFLNLGFDTGTDQSLNAMGVDSLSSVIVRNEDTGEETLLEGLTLGRALEQGLIDEEDINRTAFQIQRLGIVPTGHVLNRMFSGRMSPRTDRYQQRFTASFQPRFAQSVKWITLQPITYNVNYNWQNGSVGRNTGASVGNQVDLRGGISLRPQDFWRQFGFYKKLEQQQRDAETKAQAERQRRQQEKERGREIRRVEKEQERARKLEEQQRREQAESDSTLLLTPPNDSLALENDSLAVPQVEEPTPVAGTPVVAADTSEGGGFRLPLPDPSSLLRKSILALTGITDFTVTFSSNQTSNSTNVGRHGPGGVWVDYSLVDALRGFGPSVGYRFGLERRVGIENRVLNSSLQVTDVLSNTNKFQARTSLQPSKNLQITLNWSTDWGNKYDFTYRPLDNGGFTGTETESGSNRSFVWAFQASYLDMFKKQFETFRNDFDRSNPEDGIGDADGNGRIVLTNQSVVNDFMGSFASSWGSLDSRGLLPIPMPQWSVTYSGLSNWPIIRSLVQSAQLQHNYGAEYSTDFRTNIAAVTGDATSTFNLGNQKIIFDIPRYEVSAVRVNERYSPLIGVNLSWKNRLSTNVSWNKSNTYSLSATNFEVSEIKTDEIAVTMSFQKMGMKLPFMGGKKLNNRLSFSLMASMSENSDLRYLLRPALRDAAESYSQGTADYQPESALSGDNVSILTANKRMTVAPKISYTFSNQVTADFMLKYERFQGDSRQPSYSSMSGNFNINVRISN